ncbi:hypothetical protein CEXT_755351 [Caerostris extrusa]|uniref:Uncharacterized protein n=1 Tax=Caerostris extrusa TaxID=172846 RepID=A0AAV4PYE5_CAEEX|nr:hypothetical protein CEXT_755351 [Caerostris extrusa]
MLRLHPDRRKEADSFHYQHFRMAGPVKQCNETHEQFLAQRDPLNPFSLNKIGEKKRIHFTTSISAWPGPSSNVMKRTSSFLAQRDLLNPFELKQGTGVFDSLVRNRCWYNICSVWVPDCIQIGRKEADSFHYQHFRMAGPVKQCNETHEQFLAQRDLLNPLSLNKVLGFFDSLVRIDAGIIYVAFGRPV